MKKASLKLSQLLFLTTLPLIAGADESVSFNRDVRPILAGKCFACHGPDDQTREAGLRLDDRQEAIDYGAIEVGDANGSELVARILSDDPDLRMPPPKAGAPLSDADRDVLIRWIDQGAQYTPHWAFVPPKRPEPPSVKRTDWALNPIDLFVLNRLETEGIEPSADADAMQLVRRVYLDLIGIPPTPEQADAFVNDDDPMAYERLVDTLLQSPHYGQRWATPWLDLVRYADTNGYEKDRPRSIWPYRDWVINALNDDMPFDQFSIEQLAGDMLPDSTSSQRIATGMHRNTMLNEEGGIDPLEFRFYAMVDRVATTGVIWMGLTTGCAQCHSHKYDPITHTDYYRLMALLNNADEPDMILDDAGVAERRRELEQQIAARKQALVAQFPAAEQPTPSESTDAEQSTPSVAKDAEQPTEPTLEQRRENLKTHLAGWVDQQRKSLVDWQVIRPSEMSTTLPRLEQMEDGSIFASGDATKRDVYDLRFTFDEPTTITALRLEVLPDDRLPAQGPGLAYYEGRRGDFFLSELSLSVGGQPISFQNGSVSFGNLSIGAGDAKAENVYDGNGSTGWSTSGREGERSELVLNLSEPITVNDALDMKLLFERHFVAALGRFRVSVAKIEANAVASDLPDSVVSILKRPEDSWTPADQDAVRDQFLMVTPLLAEARKPLEALRKRLPDYPVTLIMRERPEGHQRATHRHHRGEYTSPKELVEPGQISLFEDNSQTVDDRLSLARWLVSDGNPLVGRVTVNRAWRAFFGAGLIRTSGDFGTQSDPPTHPDLLDWLAVEWTSGGDFVNKPWSMKQLHRLIVTSRTYRQSAAVRPDLLRQDRDNRLLARGPRFRVDAEMVRDIMLSSSGLLSNKMLGPSVYPPQPESVTALSYGSMAWPASKGADRYRRSLYTFSKRTAPFASFAVFDGPTGENCLPRRDRSNTPLQALTLLNDAMYLEMASALAKEAVQTSQADGPAADSEIATRIFRRVLTRPPAEAELQAILNYHEEQLRRLTEKQLDLAALNKNARPSGDASLNAQQAAWMLVARVIMNLDEAITK
ncbi:MAG: PSD1 and planctomycete cytochrome C domain-containing protein [Pirellulaceae bacterium]